MEEVIPREEDLLDLHQGCTPHTEVREELDTHLHHIQVAGEEMVFGRIHLVKFLFEYHTQEVGHLCHLSS